MYYADFQKLLISRNYCYPVASLLSTSVGNMLTHLLQLSANENKLKWYAVVNLVPQQPTGTRVHHRKRKKKQNRLNPKVNNGAVRFPWAKKTAHFSILQVRNPDELADRPFCIICPSALLFIAFGVRLIFHLASC